MELEPRFLRKYFLKNKTKTMGYLEVNWQLTTSSNPRYPELDRN